ncbi:MAG: hypothetical protein QG594_1313 [Bacteroidota bacterium]|nr:hypothetical protein [Bacteroidota bacterium]
MKYSNLYIIIALFIIIIPWTGFPFGVIRIMITLIGFVIVFLATGLFQREVKVRNFIEEYHEIKKENNTQ